MDSVKEFFQSIYDSYTDRIKNPFIGSFMISFIIFNWRVFSILFYSEWAMDKRISYIDKNYCKLENLLWPIGISFIYILVLPYFNLLIQFVLKYYTDKKQEKSDKLETARLLQRKKNAKILREIADEKAGTSEIVNLQTKIENLQKENTSLIEQNKDENQMYTARQSASHEKEKQLNNFIDKLTKDKNALEEIMNQMKGNIRHQNDLTFDHLQDLDLSKKIRETLVFLSEAERHFIMDTFGNGKSDIAYEVSETNYKMFNKFKDLNIVTSNNDWGELTVLGRYVLNFIENDFNSN